MSARRNLYPSLFTVALLTLSAFLIQRTSVFAEESNTELETNEGMIALQLEREILEKELDSYLKSGGNRRSEKFQKLFEENLKVRQKYVELHRALVRKHKEANRTKIPEAETKKKRPSFSDQKIEAAEKQQLAAVLEQMTKNLTAQRALAKQLETENSRLTEQLRTAHRELELRSKSKDPAPENVAVVFHLRHLKANLIEAQLLNVLHSENFRIASEPISNTLIVSAPKNILEKAKALIEKLDRPSESMPAAKDLLLPEALMVRVFWLSDGITNESGQNHASAFLPRGVIDALQQIGLENPYIVLQANTSITPHGEEPVSFEIDELPAVVYGDRLSYSARGEISPLGDNRLQAFIEAWNTRVRVYDNEMYHENKVRGSLQMPLNHFVVLGTANYAPAKVDEDSQTTSFAYVVQVTESKTFEPDRLRTSSRETQTGKGARASAE